MQEEKTTSDKDTFAGSNSIQVTINHSSVENMLIGPGATMNYRLNKQSEDHADILLVTATDIETAAAIKSFAGYKEVFLGKSTYYDFGTIAGAHVCLVQSEKGTASPGGSLQTVSDGISALSPTAIIMVGIAFGVRRDEQKLGNILVSQQIMAYEGQKVRERSDGRMQRIPQGDRATASTWLLNRCHNGVLDWQGPKVHFGLLLSGDKLIDNKEFRDYLLSLEPEAIGGEMEGAGLYAAAQRNNKDWLVVKAICDWADGNKGHRKHYLQKRAAEHAARFVHHIIQKGGFRQ